ncbi:MAG: nitrile hydratase subunit beta [Alphaproteobacteria bacterium]|nr:nitrile hydratase subunit beta [Alphaproteobacteria bacterium]
MRGIHDLGGLPAGPVDQAEHEHGYWEKRIDGIRLLLADKKRRLITVDEMRRGIESLGKDVYDKLSYYECWTASVTGVMLEKGVITTDELGRKMAEVEERDKARFEGG